MKAYITIDFLEKSLTVNSTSLAQLPGAVEYTNCISAEM